MIGRLYSVWFDGKPGNAFSVYPHDDDARCAFGRLLSAVCADVSAGVLEEGTDLSMDLYYHGTMNDDGVIRGAATPKLVCTGEDVSPDVMSEEVPCED